MERTAPERSSVRWVIRFSISLSSTSTSVAMIGAATVSDIGRIAFTTIARSNFAHLTAPEVLCSTDHVQPSIDAFASCLRPDQIVAFRLVNELLIDVLFVETQHHGRAVFGAGLDLQLGAEALSNALAE